MLQKSMILVPYATNPRESRGRLFTEEASPTRSPFQRDRDRVVHSTAFRRLEYKTQVFVNHEGDHYRTRLTHSLEVSQLARSVCSQLGLNEELAEAVALSHDLGHTPFGHAGEEALDGAMREWGGFSHNAQTIRVLTFLEKKYAGFDGLNLTWETLEGIAKHNGPVSSPHKNLAAYCGRHDLELGTWPGPEAQIASLADDIAYHNHDMDDSLRAGIVEAEELLGLPLVGDVFREVAAKYPGLAKQRVITESIRRVVDAMVRDLVSETGRRIKESGVAGASEIRALGRPVAAFSADMQKVNAALKAFLMEKVYRHYKVNRMTSKAKRVVREMFEFFLAEPECLPTQWREAAGKPGSAETAQIVADFIAGMTDRFALEEYRRVFDVAGRG